MTAFNHAVVWISHNEAKVFRFSDEEETEVDVHSHTSLQRLHHRATGWEAGGNPPDDSQFYHRITAVLDAAGSIVIAGPGSAKVSFKAYLDHSRPSVAARVCALETLEHPRADELLTIGRRYFNRAIRTPAPAATHSPA